MRVQLDFLGRDFALRAFVQLHIAIGQEHPLGGRLAGRAGHLPLGVEPVDVSWAVGSAFGHPDRLTRRAHLVLFDRGRPYVTSVQTTTHPAARPSGRVGPESSSP